MSSLVESAKTQDQQHHQPLDSEEEVLLAAAGTGVV